MFLNPATLKNQLKYIARHIYMKSYKQRLCPHKVYSNQGYLVIFLVTGVIAVSLLKRLHLHVKSCKCVL